LDQIDALEKAIEHERNSMEDYKKKAELAEDPETRLLFAQLAREEEVHYRKLVERLKALRAM